MKKHAFALFAGCAASLACGAAKPPASTTPASDLTVPVISHRAVCPPPSQAPCVIRKPVGTNYRVLTPGLDLEDAGDRWVANFDKAAAGKARFSIRVLDTGGGLHDIAVSFSTSAPKAKAGAR